MNSKEKLVNKIRFACLEQIFNCLNDFDYAMIKGEVTSLYAYGQLNKRYYNDIDILIKKENLSQIDKILESNGFQKITKDRNKELFFKIFSHQVVPYQKYFHGIKVLLDLNYDIFWGEKKSNGIYIHNILQNTIKSNIFGIDVKVLSVEKAFLQLCLHCYKDLNSIYLIYSRRKIKLMDLYEIYYILKRHKSQLSKKVILELAHKYKATPYLYVVFNYIFELTKDSSISGYMMDLESVEGKKLLNVYGLSKHNEWKISVKERLKCDDLYNIILPDLDNVDLKNIQDNIIAFEGDY